MNRIQQGVLGLVWACGMEGSDPIARMFEHFTAGEICRRLNGLMYDGMITGDMRVTSKGRAALTVVLCGGVFDIIHHGHVHALAAAKSLGDVLVVVVASDGTVKKTNKTTHHDACTRRRIVGSVGVVDVCKVGHDADIFRSVAEVRPDIIALGYDQTHHTAAIEAGCRRLGLDTRVVRLKSPVPDVSSSNLKKGVSLKAM